MVIKYGVPFGSGAGSSAPQVMLNFYVFILCKTHCEDNIIYIISINQLNLLYSQGRLLLDPPSEYWYAPPYLA